jgi:hypothetical protein
MWPTYFITLVTMLFLLLGRLAIFIILDHNITSFLGKVYFLRGKVFPGVPNALTPPRIGRISLWMSNNLQKTANKQSQKFPKMTLDKLMGQIKTYRKTLLNKR